MAETVAPRAWRKARDHTTIHTRDVVQHDLPKEAVDALMRLATELDSAKTEIDHLKRVVGSLAEIAMDGDRGSHDNASEHP